MQMYLIEKGRALTTAQEDTGARRKLSLYINFVRNLITSFYKSFQGLYKMHKIVNTQ